MHSREREWECTFKLTTQQANYWKPVSAVSGFYPSPKSGNEIRRNYSLHFRA